MRLFELLNEDTEPLRVKKIVSYLKQNCTVALRRAEREIFIFRGRQRSGKVLLFKPHTTPRVSHDNLYNYYNLLLSNLDNWSHYPRRDRSLIGTTSIENAKDYGHLYYVFPLGNPNIAICPDIDLWESFPRVCDKAGIITLEPFNQLFHWFLAIALGKQPENILKKKEEFKPLDQNYIQLEKAFTDIKDLWNKNPELIRKRFEAKPLAIEAYPLYDTVFKEFKGDVKAALMDMFDPKKNGFKQVPLNKLNVQGHKEVWLSAPAVLIEEEYYETNLQYELFRISL